MPRFTQATAEGSITSISPTNPSPITIAFIEAGTADGGAISWLLSSRKYLDRRRFEPLIIYYAAGGAMVEKIRALGVPLYFASTASPGHFPAWLRPWPLRKCVSLCRTAYRFLLRDVFLIRAVRKYLRERRVALVVLNSDLHFQYCGAIAARLEKLPILCRKSGGIQEGLRRKKLLTPFVDVFVPVSKVAEKDQLANSSTKRSVLVYEGVDMSRTAAESYAPRSDFRKTRKSSPVLRG
jgi:hypothetical protein